MAALQGTLIISPVVPPDDRDAFPTHIETFGKGGFRAVQSVVDRDAITLDRRKEGMLVYVIDEDTTYRLVNSNWVRVSTETAIIDLEAEQLVQNNRLDSLETRADETDAEQLVQDNRLDVLETRADETDTEQATQDNRLDIIEDKLPFQGSYLSSSSYTFDTVLDPDFDSEAVVDMSYFQGTVETGATTKFATIRVSKDGITLYDRTIAFGNLGVSDDAEGLPLSPLNFATDAADVLALLSYTDQKSITVYVPNGAIVSIVNADPEVTSVAGIAHKFNKRSF